MTSKLNLHDFAERVVDRQLPGLATELVMILRCLARDAIHDELARWTEFSGSCIISRDASGGAPAFVLDLARPAPAVEPNEASREVLRPAIGAGAAPSREARAERTRELALQLGWRPEMNTTAAGYVRSWVSDR